MYCLALETRSVTRTVTIHRKHALFILDWFTTSSSKERFWHKTNLTIYHINKKRGFRCHNNKKKGVCTMYQDNSIESTKKFFSFSYKFLENVDCGGESIKILTDDAKCTINFFPLLLLVCMSGTCFAEFR